MIKIYTHLSQLVTLKEALAKDGRKLLPNDLSIITDGAVVFDEKQILWVGKSSDLPDKFSSYPQTNLSGHTLTPEVVDSHTHLVFGGNRATEYVDRLNGTSYEEIATRGGGILFTVKETNSKSADELFELASTRIKRINSYGIGTIEIKSGYALNFDDEIKLSDIINRLKKQFSPGIRIFNTTLAAHDVPKKFSSSTQYLNDVAIPVLEKLAQEKIIDAVDIFHEKNYFSTSDVELLFKKAQELNIPCKIHADELNDNSGASLAVKFKALSADHLLKISDAGIKDVADSKTVATLLPGTAFFLGKPLAPARKMLDAGVKLSIASDYNPGSCHCDNLILIASLCAAQLKINQAELWSAITLNGAHALGLKNQGAIVSGLDSRFSLFKCENLAEVTYNWGRNFAVSLP